MGSGDSNVRTSTSGMPIDSRREITAFTRQQLVRKARWLYNNLGVVRGMINNTSRFTVGTGISPIPTTGDVEFDVIVEDYFCDWADSAMLCDISGRLDFWTLQKNVLRSMLRDGECFVVKASENGGIPQFQWLESQFIGSRMAAYHELDKDGFRDGIKCDQYGAVLAYKRLSDRNRSEFDLSNEDIIPASALLHVYDYERSQQIRGLTWLYAGVNSALDIMDLTTLEKHATKIHSVVAATIRKKTGDAGPVGFGGTYKKTKVTGSDGKQRVIAFDNFIGGSGILQLAMDEEFKLEASNRESATFNGFIEFLVRDLAAGFGTTTEFVWSMIDASGPNVRSILALAGGLFEELQDLLVRLLCRPLYMWVVARGIQSGEIVVPEGVKNPYSCAWMGPAKITVDQGKEGNLQLERLKSGCGTWEEFWAERGKSGRKMVKARIDELAWAMEYAASKKGPGHEDGVPFDYLITLNKGGDGGPSNGEVAETAKHEEKPTEKLEAK
jgi:lambda family phage portal protein